MTVAATAERKPETLLRLAMERLRKYVHGIAFILVPRSFAPLNSNAWLSRSVCGGVCVLLMGAQRPCTLTTPRTLWLSKALGKTKNTTDIHA